jgi:hypothetical protein
MRTIVSWVNFVVLSFVVSAVAAQALAQGAALDLFGDPTFGMIKLEPGFEADPYNSEVLSGGRLDASYLIDSKCAGFVGSAPHFRLNWTGKGSDLRIFFVGDGDATLAVNDPYGDWHCNDDFDDRNPLVGFKDADFGQYDIWVGSFHPEATVFGNLYITELVLSPIDFSLPIAELAVSAPPNFGEIALGVDFMPDPYRVQVLSGGSIDVSSTNLPNNITCVGYATTEPDFRLDWTEEGAGILRIMVVADADTTLIVNDPSGDWHCDDNTYGSDPVVEFEPPKSGLYDIWVGSNESAATIPGTLFISKLRLNPSVFY